jgi:hypothetical protein
VTIDVNAEPPEDRAHMFPRMPIVNAPMADTTSEWLKIYLLATLFVANDAHDMITITSRFLLLFESLAGCRLARDESIENTGTIKNWAQNGMERRYHGSVGGR